MSSLKLLGVVLIVFGAITLAYKGFSYRSKEKLFEIGSAKIEATTKKHVAVPMWVGFALVAGGVVLLATGKKKSA